MITSKNNDNIRLLDKLINQKKYRRQNQMYVVEGEKLLLEAIRYGKQIVSVYVQESCLNTVPQEVSHLVVPCLDSVLQSVAPTVTTQGILTVLKMDEQQLVSPRGDVLVLDGLQDPGNVGTLLRTAVAFGFLDVFCANTVDIYSPKVIRSAMSAHFALRLFSFDSIEQALSALPNNNMVLAGNMNGMPVDKFVRSTPNIALVLGNEGNGLSEYSRQHITNVVSLPMSNNLESLNVAVAGGILMYVLKQ